MCRTVATRYFRWSYYFRQHTWAQLSFSSTLQQLRRVSPALKTNLTCQDGFHTQLSHCHRLQPCQHSLVCQGWPSSDWQEEKCPGWGVTATGSQTVVTIRCSEVGGACLQWPSPSPAWAWEIYDEWQGGVPDDSSNVLQQNAIRRQDLVQRLPDQTCKGTQCLICILDAHNNIVAASLLSSCKINIFNRHEYCFTCDQYEWISCVGVMDGCDGVTGVMGQDVTTAVSRHYTPLHNPAHCSCDEQK